MKTKIIFLGILIGVIFSSVEAVTFDEEKGSFIQREEMVRTQVRARGIKDEGTLSAMRKVKRHLFVPLMHRHLSYEDYPLPIGEGQTISQPYIVALMTELLELKGEEKVLEIGTGSGYQAAILAGLAKEVYTIEILEPLAVRSQKLLKELGYENIQVKYGDGFLGWPECGPFNAIIVTCAPEEVPPTLLEQLAEGGRLVIPVGRHWQELKRLKKIEGEIISESIIPVRFVPMLRDKGSKKKEKDYKPEKTLENLKRHTIELSREIGERNCVFHQNLERSADYIKKEFKSYGYEVKEQVYHLKGKPFRNIVAVKKGRNLADKIIVVGTHYDSVVGSPGADDNASAVAGLLELARLLTHGDLNKTVKFIAFVNEEPPFFMSKDMGSFRYASEARREGDKIEAMLCLESIGYYSDEKTSQKHPLGLRFFYPDKGNFIAAVSNISSYPLLKKVVREFKKASSFPMEHLVAPALLAPAINFSDHWSFWKFGYQAVMITNTAFYRNPYYHTPQDTYEKLNYEYMAEVVSGLYYVILNLAA